MTPTPSGLHRPGIVYRARRHVWLRAGEPLLCPSGHKLRHNVAVLGGQEAFICQHVEPGQRGECGKRVYLMQLPGGLRFVAEVTVAEMLHLREAHLGVEDTLAYLGGAAA
jgi:hypothetical protein